MNTTRWIATSLCVLILLYLPLTWVRAGSGGSEGHCMTGYHEIWTLICHDDEDHAEDEEMCADWGALDDVDSYVGGYCSEDGDYDVCCEQNFEQ
jgi:hypothetical protein